MTCYLYQRFYRNLANLKIQLMNPRDLPEVVAELIIEMHEVQTELRGLREDMQKELRGLREDMQTELRGLREDMQNEQRSLREDMQAMPDRIGMAVIKSLEPFLNRLLDHDDQLKNHEQRLTELKKSQE
jgi:ribosome recycling factor